MSRWDIPFRREGNVFRRCLPGRANHHERWLLKARQVAVARAIPGRRPVAQWRTHPGFSGGGTRTDAVHDTALSLVRGVLIQLSWSSRAGDPWTPRRPRLAFVQVVTCTSHARLLMFHRWRNIDAAVNAPVEKPHASPRCAGEEPRSGGEIHRWRNTAAGGEVRRWNKDSTEGRRADEKLRSEASRRFRNRRYGYGDLVDRRPRRRKSRNARAKAPYVANKPRLTRPV